MLTLSVAQRRVLLTLAISAGLSPAFADSSTVFDARSMAMGGTGVASSRLGSAALFNPALLAVPDDHDHFALTLPAVGAQITDEGNLHTKVKDLQNGAYNASVNDYNNLNNNFSSATTAKFSTDLGQLNTGIAGLSGQPADIQLGLIPFSMAFHNPVLSFGIFTNVTADVAARFNEAGSDQTTLANYQTLMGGISPYVDQIQGGTSAQRNAGISAVEGLLANPQYANLLNPGCVSTVQSQQSGAAVASCFKDPSKTVASTVEAVGAAIGELGVALAMNVDGIAVGVTPKVLEVKTYYYYQNLNNNNVTASSITNNSRSQNALNLDAGVAYVVPNSPYKVGASVRNLIPENFSTATESVINHNTNQTTYANASVHVDPQLTVGGEAHWSRATLTADLDLTRNRAPVAWGSSTQFLGLGGELDLWVLKLRGGFRQNLANGPIKNELTAGLGLGPLSIAATYASNTVGAMAQLGFNF